MINEQNGETNQQPIDDATLGEAVNQAMHEGLRLSYEVTPDEQALIDGNGISGEPTPDEVWEYFAANRTKTFDKSTAEGKRLFELFRVANKERNKFTMEQVKAMMNVVGRVPADIASGLIRSPLKAPLSAVDAMARDVHDLYGILAQSEDPDSVFFRFKNYIKGTGTIEEQIDQFNEARWFNNRSQELEEGKATVLEDWVPADYKDFVKSMIDPKLANALSYIGLDIPHVLLSPLKSTAKRALRESVSTYKNAALGMKAAEQVANSADEGIASIATSFRDVYENNAKRFKEFALRTTGGAIAGTADAVAKPFTYVQQKIAQGSSAVAETAGSNPTILRNAAQTALADAGERTIGEGLSLSPIRSTLFSLGVKPLTEYASVLGNEIVDYANGVVQVKPQHTGMGMLERLAQKNGSKIPMSAEALAVAKFTNVVVGWPASMAVPVLQRAVGDAAYMSVLGYMNARGAGGASGAGIGFSWGGLSGSLRHIHNVYSQNQGHEYVISNFDNSHINMIEAKNPDNGKAIRSALQSIDNLNDNRISATVRAVFAQAFTSDPEYQFRFGGVEDLIKEFGLHETQVAFGGPNSPEWKSAMRGNGLGSNIRISKNGATIKVGWINSKTAKPETIPHEIAHRHLDNLFENDADSVEIVKQFFGDGKDMGVISDEGIAHLYADYFSKMYADANDPSPVARKNMQSAYEIMFEKVKGDLSSMRSEIASGNISFDRILKRSEDGVHVPEPINAYPELFKAMHEVFAYSYSNSILHKSPDFFLRSPEHSSLRASLENIFMLRTQRIVSKAEEAGVLFRKTDTRNPDAQLGAFMWENGNYLYLPMLDSWTKKVMSMAMRHGDVNVSLMSPERADAFFKQTGKERFSTVVKGGKGMKGKVEVDEIITENTKRVMDALESLPESERPRFNISQGGNQILDLSNLNKKQWDAIINSKTFSKSEIDDLRGITEVVKNVRSGKPVFNVFTGQYLGRTQQVVIDGQVRRLTGSDVPVTNRHFSPYAVELRFDKYDENGNPLRKAKGHITIHCVDVRVLNRRRMKMWQRPDVRSLFTDFGHYTRTFTDYMHNLSQDSSSRKTSVERFKPEFGDKAETVRDIMYETFGGRKRMDESFINVPTTGYTGPVDGPNYPFHSLRFELLANLQKQTSVFQETFGTNGLGALPYNHVNAYEGVRRNLMVGGFVEYPVGKDGKYWSNHLGYEIRKADNRLTLFSPFGAVVGVFKTLQKAQSYAERHMKSIPDEETRGFVGTEQGPAPEGDDQIRVTIKDVTSHSTNMMVGKKGYYDAEVRLVDNKDWESFIDDAKAMRHGINHARDENTFYGQASISLSKILKNSKLIADYPFLGDFEIAATPLSVLHGGYVEGLWGSRNGRTVLAIPVSHVTESLGKNAEKSIKAVLQPILQEIISFADGDVESSRLAYIDGDIRYIGNTAMMAQMKRMSALLAEMQKENKDATLTDVLEAEADKNIEDALDYWGYDGKKVLKVFNEFGGNRGLTKQEVKTIDSHVRGILDSFKKKGKGSYVVQAMNATTIFVDPRVLRMSDELNQILDRKIDPSLIGNSTGFGKRIGSNDEPLVTYRQVYDEMFMQGLSGFHHVAKRGDRSRKNSNAPLHQIEIESNKYAESEGKVIPSGSPDAEVQTVIGLNGIEDYAIFTIGRSSDPNERVRKNPLDASEAPRYSYNASFITPATSFTSLSFTQRGKGIASTTDTQVIPKYSPLSRTGRRNGGINVSINSILAFNGQAPYLHGENGSVISKGSLHKHVANGDFSRMLEYMYSEAFPEEYAKAMEKFGKDDPFSDHTFVRRIATSIWSKGITTPQELATFHFATALSQIIIGENMINGTPIGEQAVGLMMKDIARVNDKDAGTGKDYYRNRTDGLRSAGYFSPEYLGAGSVNEGVARIMLLGERMGWGTIFGKQGIGNFVKALGGDDAKVKSAESFKKSIENVGTQLDGILKQSGFDKDKPMMPVSEYGTPAMFKSNMMVGGFFGSLTADERMMGAAGMLRLVKTENGTVYKAFEFSDKGSSLSLGAVDDKIHLLPFMNDLDSPTKGFESFIKEYRDAVDNKDSIAIENAIKKIPSIRLDEILKHDLLYRFYPSLKSVRVGFVEGFGAGYYPRQNFIVLGIDRIISGEIAKANGVSELIIPDQVRANSVHSSLLHEVQHAIQRMETWTQSGDVTESAQYKRGIFKYLLRNIMGLSGPFFGPLEDARMKGGEAIKLEIEKAREAGLDDPEIRKVLELSPEAMNQHILELTDSPMAQRVFEIAAPSAHQLFGSDAMVYERLSYELASKPKDAERMANHAREMLQLKDEARIIMEESKNGTFTDEQAHMMIFGESGLLERRDNIFKAIDKSFGKEVSDLAYEYTSHHSRYLDLALDVGRAMDNIKYSREHGVGFNAVRMRNLVHSLGLMQYYGQMSERQAYETSERMKMSQEELNKKERSDGSYLLKDATDSRSNSLRNLGIMMKKGEVPRVANMMIGGLGKGVDVISHANNDYRLDALQKVARLSTISYYVSAADHELLRLGRYVVSARGWEVKDGKARLVYKTGILESRKLKNGELEQSPREKYGRRANASIMYENTNDGIDTTIHIYNGLSEDGMNSISMDEVARLVDGTVVMENELATPTEAVDAVYRQDFPDRVNIDELAKVLTSMGVSEDGIQMANIGAIQSAFAGSNMSKDEIANIMAIHHQFVISEFAYGKAFGSERITKALSESSPTPENLSKAIRDVWGKSGGDSLAHALQKIGVDPNAWKKNESNRKSFGLFNAGKGVIQFSPIRPDFIPEELWSEWVDSKKADGTWPKDKNFIELDYEEIYRRFDVYGQSSKSDSQVKQLNRLYAQRCVKIRPIFEKFMEKIDSASKELKFALIDEAIMMRTRYEPESVRTVRGDEFGIRQQYREDLGTAAQRLAHEEIFKQDNTDPSDQNTGATGRFGPNILLGNVFRESGSLRDENMMGSDLVLLPTVGHTFDKTINNAYGEANATFGLPVPTEYEIHPSGHPKYSLHETIQDLGLIALPFNITYSSDVFSRGNSRVFADYALRSIDSSHYGLLRIIQEMTKNYDSKIKSAVTRLERLNGAVDPSAIDAIAENGVSVLAVLKGLATSMELITNSIQDRQSLIVPFNAKKMRVDSEPYNPRNYASKSPSTTVARTRGYVGADGSIVVESIDENVLNGSTSHNDVLAIPYLLPPSSGSREGVTNALQRLHRVVLSGVVGDLERAILVNGEIDDRVAGVNIPSGEIHRELNRIIGNGFATPSQIDNLEVSLRENNFVAYTGVHALHSSLYQLIARKGIDHTALVNAIQASPELLELLQKTDFNGLGVVHPTQRTDTRTQIDSHLYAVAMVPILTKAFSESTITFRDGKINKSDILTETQRQEFKALLAEVSDENLGMTPAGGDGNEAYIGRITAFLASLTQEQKTLISEMCSDVNSNMLLDSMISGMQGMAAIELLGTYPAMEALIPNFKEEMRESMRKYIQTGAIQWEQGVQSQISDPILRKNMADEKPYKQAVLLLLRSDSPNAFGRFLYGIRALNKFPAFEMSRGESNSHLVLAKDEKTASARGLFRMSLLTSDHGWSVVSKDLSGDVSKRFIIDHNSPEIRRTHCLKDSVSLARNSPAYFGIRAVAGAGFGDSLLAPIKYEGTDGFSEKIGKVEGTHTRIIVPKRAASASKPFVRKMLVNMLVREAQKAGTGKISLQPARISTVGRPLVGRGQLQTAGKNGLMGQKGFFYDQGVRTIPLLGNSSPVPRMFSGASPSDTAFIKVGAVAPYGQKASLGFAFKRLEDGRIVINISGDVLGYKNFTTLSSRSGWEKLSMGVNLEEALGYSVHDKTIAHMDPKYIGTQIADLQNAYVPIANLLGVFGGSWRKEIIKKAHSILNNGTHETRQVNQRIISNSTLFLQGTAESLGEIASGNGNHNDPKHIIAAMALMRDNATDNFLTLTIPAGLSQDEVRAHVYTFLMERIGVNNVMSLIGHRRDATNEFNVFASTVSSGFMNDDGNLIRRVMGEEGLPYSGGSSVSSSGTYPRGSLHGVLEQHVREMSNSGSDVDTTIKSMGPRSAAETLTATLPHLSDDIDKLVAMVTGKDSGYFLPDLERQLAMNGDKRSAIEALFPDRPELSEFAWDNSSNSNVTIVPRREGKKIVGYLVGYDIPSGIDKSTGRPVMSRKVTVVKTMSEAESLRNKFTLSTSKAELALAIDTLSNQTGKFAVNSTGVTRQIHAPVRRNTRLKVSEMDKGSGMFELDYSNGSTYTVGDLDLRLTKEQAEALQVKLTVPDVLQTEVVEVRKPNMMVGATGSDPKELESLLRRKINFGTGMGRVEFSSRLMNVIAHGKTKSGKNKYPELMTGAEWYKFIRENAVSKDEIRMSGIAHLLFENKDSQISRSELAEFVFTMYPRNIRQDRGGPLSDVPYLSSMTATNGSNGFLPNSFIYPFIFDAEAKERQVMDAHLSNLDAIMKHVLELSNGDDDSKARAQILDTTIKKTLDELVDVAGLPKEILSEDSLAGKIGAIGALIRKGMTDEKPEEYVTGSSRRIRPAQVDYLVQAIVNAKMEEVNGIARTAIGSDIGLVDPWNWAFSHTGSKYDQFDLADGTRHRAERRLIIKDPASATNNDRLLIQQGVLHSTGNAHESMATYKGNYTSSIWLTELWSNRMDLEHQRFVSILENRLKSAANPEDARRIQSIIDASERVKVMRSSFDAEMSRNMGSAGHYATPIQGTFQLGHIRTTAGSMTASHGIHTLGTGIGSIDESDPVLGIRREFEPTFHIEEIQSDTFQYKRFGETTRPEFAMPDTLEQAGSLRDVSAYQGIKKQIQDISESLSDTNQALLNHLNNVKQRNSTHVNGPIFNKMFWKVLESTGPIERWLLKRDLIDVHFPSSTILTENGGTIKLPPAMASEFGVSEIPSYSWNKEYHKHDSEFTRDVSQTLSKALFSASAHALAEIAPKNFGVLDMDTFNFGSLFNGEFSDNTSVTPTMLLLQYAMLDDQAQMSALEMKRGLLGLSAPNFDFDAMADRLIDRVQAAVTAWKKGDPSFRRFNSGNNAVKVKMLEAFVETLRELQRSSRLEIPNYTHSIESGPAQNRELIADLVKNKQNFAGGRFVAYNWDDVKSNLGTHQTFVGKTKRPTLSPDDFELKYNEGFTLRYRLTSEMANNALSQLLMDYMSIFACQADIGDAPKKLEKLNATLNDMSKRMAVSTNADQPMPDIITSQPYGIEDIYRPISMQGTVLRAANAGYRQVGMTDARHHFVRGHGSESRAVMTLGRRRRVFINADGALSYPLRAIRLLPDNQFYALHGGLFERLRQMEDSELKPILLGRKFTHNGIDAQLGPHVVHAIMDSKDFVELAKNSSNLHYKEMAAAVSSPEYMRLHFGDFQSLMGLPDQSAIEKAFSEDGGNALLTEDGKPVAYRKKATQWWSRAYGDLVSGEKNGAQRLIDAAAASVGQAWIMAEYERGSGYINNYGLPLWYQRLNYAGQEHKNLVKASTDAFERPVLERGEDGMYRVLDPKTAKLITQSNDPEIVREVLLQNSKYLGGLPYISGFLGEWRDVGGYVMSGYGHGVPIGNAPILPSTNEQFMPYTTNPFDTTENITEFTFHPSEGEAKERKQVFMRNDPKVNDLVRDSSLPHSIHSRADRSWKQVPTHASDIPIKLITKLVFGLEPTEVNVGKAIRLMNSNASTIFRFAPNFQTDAQKMAFRKKVIAGIPSMMVGGMGENGMPQANPSLLAWLQNISANYEKAGKMRRALYDIHQNQMTIEEASKKHELPVSNIRRSESRLRNQGVEFPRRIPEHYGDVERVLNPETSRPRIPQETVQLIIQMAKSGHSQREIARAIGMSRGTVNYYLKQNFPDYRPERADPTEPYGGPHA